MIKQVCKIPFALLSGVLLLAAWLFLCETSLARSNQGTLHYVSASGSCGGMTPCYSTIQAAVDAALDGDELHVAAGTYSGVSERNGSSQLVYLDKSLTLRGGFNPSTWLQDPDLTPSTLDAQELGRGLTINGEITPTIDGFSLINGVSGNGGGVFIKTAGATLSRNKIHDNHAEGFGGGVYLENSAAQILDNQITQNSTGINGRGGGLLLLNSPALLQDNLIEGNQAHVGGGVQLTNYVGESGAKLTGNTIRDNFAFDYFEYPYTFDGAGGAIDSHSYVSDTIQDNLIQGNSAKWGGGVHGYGAPLLIRGNVIQENTAPIHGGGLYIQGGQLRLENNQILTNTAENWGGGLTLMGNGGILRGNTFRGNSSNWRGGGLYISGSIQGDGNLFLENSVSGQGGGAFLAHGAGGTYENSVFVGNQATEGEAIFIWAADVAFEHTTIADNNSSDGRAVVIDKYPGLVDPEAQTLYTATVVFDHSIIAGQPVGFFATSENSLTVDGVLWWQTPMHVQAAGAELIMANEFTGDPIFQPDGYHLRAYSEARDKAASDLVQDVDGQLRDGSGKNDLGADEFVPVVVIDPDVGGVLTYTTPTKEVTITLNIPEGAFDEMMGLMISPFPPLPPDVMQTPLGKFVAVGPPFSLDPYGLDPSTPVQDPLDPVLADPAEPLMFGYPASLVLEVGIEKFLEMQARMEELEAQLFSLFDAMDSGELAMPPINPACGTVTHDEEERTMEVPICDTGIFPDGVQASDGLPVRLMELDPEGHPGVFVFVVEVVYDRIYLPLINR